MKSSAPNIFVIIPVYNCENFVDEAINSVLNQPYKNINIVLVNDGSKDNSPEICDRYAQQYDRVHVIHQENAGVSVARNTGIEYVLTVADIENDYLAFVDSDDMWCENAITPVLFKRECAGYNLPLLALGTVRGNEKLSRFQVSKTYVEREDIGSNNIWNVNGHFGACLYPVSILKKFNIRFSEKLKYSEDKIFLLQNVYLSKRVRFVNKQLYIYRKNSASAMNKVRHIPAIDYYNPIVFGWVASDEFLNQFEAETEKRINSGHVLAGIYLMDMAAGHFEQWRSAKEIYEELATHVHRPLLINLRPQDVSKSQYRNSRLLLKQPLIFAWKYRMMGLAKRLIRPIFNIPIMRNYVEKRIYPIDSVKNVNCEIKN